MNITNEMRQQIMNQAQGALSLQIAFIGIINGLFSVLARIKKTDAMTLARETNMDSGYVERWCDAAFAFEFLDENRDEFTLTPAGFAFLPEQKSGFMPFAVGNALFAYMADRVAECMPGGEQPGEIVLEERKTILPWFGLMLEGMFSNLFETEILPGIPLYKETAQNGGLVVDLGCGNGWYIRKYAQIYPGIRGIGIDAIDENIKQAENISNSAGLADRLTFTKGDIYTSHLEEAADIIVMNRALHHVWSEKEKTFERLKSLLKPGGSAIIWEPCWPENRRELRDPQKRAMAFQNLTEHLQGNHLLQPVQIEKGFENVGMSTETFFFADRKEVVIVGKKE